LKASSKTFEDLREEEEESEDKAGVRDGCEVRALRSLGLVRDWEQQMKPEHTLIISWKFYEMARGLRMTAWRPSQMPSLTTQDFPYLWKAPAKLTVFSKDNKIDVIFQACLIAMVSTLNLYLDPESSYTWWEESILVSKSQNQGANHT